MRLRHLLPFRWDDWDHWTQIRYFNKRFNQLRDLASQTLIKVQDNNDFSRRYHLVMYLDSKQTQAYNLLQCPVNPLLDPVRFTKSFSVYL